MSKEDLKEFKEEIIQNIYSMIGDVFLDISEIINKYSKKELGKITTEKLIKNRKIIKKKILEENKERTQIIQKELDMKIKKKHENMVEAAKKNKFFKYVKNNKDREEFKNLNTIKITQLLQKEWNLLSIEEKNNLI